MTLILTPQSTKHSGSKWSPGRTKIKSEKVHIETRKCLFFRPFRGRERPGYLDSIGISGVPAGLGNKDVVVEFRADFLARSIRLDAGMLVGIGIDGDDGGPQREKERKKHFSF